VPPGRRHDTHLRDAFPHEPRRAAKLATGDPDREVARARQCYQKLRNIYHARIARGFYRLRCLLAADGHRPYRTQQINHA
jgi:hypothetical protein